MVFIIQYFAKQNQRTNDYVTEILNLQLLFRILHILFLEAPVIIVIKTFFEGT